MQEAKQPISISWGECRHILTIGKQMMPETPVELVPTQDQVILNALRHIRPWLNVIREQSCRILGDAARADINERRTGCYNMYSIFSGELLRILDAGLKVSGIDVEKLEEPEETFTLDDVKFGQDVVCCMFCPWVCGCLKEDCQATVLLDVLRKHGKEIKSRYFPSPAESLKDDDETDAQNMSEYLQLKKIRNGGEL